MCKECNEDFYIELVGKSLMDAAQLLMNLFCPRCKEKTRINVDAHLFIAVPKDEERGRPIDREMIYIDVDRERDHQDEKHPVFPKNDYERASILVEEVGEVAQVLNHLKELNLTPEEYITRLESELNDVIGVGVRWREALKMEGH